MPEQAPRYSSLLDQILDDVEPDYSELGLKGPKSSGDAFNELSKDHVDTGFLDSIAGHSRHQTALGQVQASYSPRQLNSNIEADTEGTLNEAFQTLNKAEKTEVSQKGLTDKEIEMRVRVLLNLGYTREKVAAYIDKVAELKIMDNSKGLGADFLKAYAPGLGIAYMEPNFYMTSCVKSFEKVKKEGSLKALSVKKISSCANCKYHNCGTCNLYHLPIVASAQDIKKVVTSALKAKNIKYATLSEGLNKLASGGKKESNRVMSSAPNTGVTRTAGDKTAKILKEASAKEIGESLKAGIPLPKVFKAVSASYGKASAMAAIKKYISQLKTSKQKVVIDTLDCSFLKGKLSSLNPIIGSSKCSTCTYRNCMSCGLTGGTLVSYPGMGKTAAPAVEGVDGLKMLKDWELDVKEDTPLEINEPKQADTSVDLTSSSRIDIE